MLLSYGLGKKRAGTLSNNLAFCRCFYQYLSYDQMEFLYKEWILSPVQSLSSTCVQSSVESNKERYCSLLGRIGCSHNVLGYRGN